MKQFIRTSIAAALTLMSVACTRKEMESVSDESLVTRTFSAAFSDSKVSLDGLKPVWSADDEIAVFDGTAIRKFTIISGEGTSSAEFTGEVAEQATEFQAAFPFALVKAMTAESITLSVPETQVIPEGGVVDPSALAQVAVFDNGIFQFKNVTALVKLEIAAEADVKTITLRGADSEKIVGGVTALPDATGITAQGSAVLSVEAAGAAFTDGTYYAAIVPTVFENGFKVAATGADGTIRVRATSARQEFGRNTCLNFGDFLSGASTLPLEINSADEFAVFASNAELYPASATVTLGSSVDLSELSAGVLPANAFSGIFDGQGNSLFNFTAVSDTDAAVFSSLEGKGQIRNLVLGSANGTSYDGISVIRHASSDADAQNCIAAPIAYVMNEASVERVVNYASIEIASDGVAASYTAGIVGHMRSTASILNCKNYGSVTALASAKSWIDVGGVVGTSSGKNCNIKSCENHGALLFNSAACAVTINMGGIVAGATAGLYEDCHNYGTVTVGKTSSTYSSAINIGGILGWNNGSLSGLKNCVNEQGADITNNAAAANDMAIGGIVGKYGSATNYVNPIDGCVNKAAVVNNGVPTKTLNIGGIVGDVTKGITSPSPIMNCVTTATASVTNNATSTNYVQIGGIMGRCTSAIEITGNENNATVSNTAALTNLVIGGICGEIGTAGTKKFESNTNKGAIINKGNASSRYCVGGLLGRSAIANTFKNCGNSGAVTAEGDGAAWTGGIVGCVNTAVFTADHCNNSGDVSATGAMGNSYTGGIAGYVDVPAGTAVNFTSCRNTGDVTIASTKGGSLYQYTGGIVGTLHSKTNSAVVSYCVNDGKVLSKTAVTNANGIRVGGICGGSVYTNKFLNCRNNGEVCNESNSTQAHLGGILGYSSGACTMTADTCSLSSKVWSKGDATVANIGGILGATGAANIVITNCCSAATIVQEGTVTTVNAHQIEGGRYSADLKTVSNCKVAGNVLGTEVSAENYADYLTATGTPSGCGFWSDAL